MALVTLKEILKEHDVIKKIMSGQSHLYRCMPLFSLIMMIYAKDGRYYLKT